MLCANREAKASVDVDKAAEDYRVLIVDDCEPICREVKWCLEGLYGVKVFTASNGQQGLEMMVKHRPSLVILDLLMPVMDGFEFLKRKKVIAAAQNIPVVVLTAKETNDNVIVDVLLAGATDFLRKPIDANDLQQYIAARIALARHAADRRLHEQMSNPLTIVIALGKFLQNPEIAGNPDEVMRYGKQIAESGRRLQAVLSQLLHH